MRESITNHTCFRKPVLLAAMLWLANHALAEEVASYSGSISAGQNQRFFDAVKGKAITRLVITSDGGEVAAGIALGLWVFEHRIDIDVPEYCLSSCANYVFPAGQRKTIGAGAVVAWHGNYNHLKQTGLWQDEVAGRVKRYGEDSLTAEARVRAEVDRLARLEHDFFARIGVNEYLCWIGKMPPYNAPNYYYLSSQDMARFGVTHVQTSPDYEDTDVSGFDDHIMYIRLGQ
jgi:hypothetical protein